jgi:hypothetical protein
VNQQLPNDLVLKNNENKDEIDIKSSSNQEVEKNSKNTFNRSKIIKRRHSKYQKNIQIKNIDSDLNELIKNGETFCNNEDNIKTLESLSKTKTRNVILERDKDLGFGFIAGSEKPMVIRFVSPSNFIKQ